MLEEGQADKPVVDLDPAEPRVDGVLGEAEPPPEAPKPEADNAKDLKEIDWSEYLETYGNEFHGASFTDSATTTTGGRHSRTFSPRLRISSAISSGSYGSRA